jgi:hypothetical protein
MSWSFDDPLDIVRANSNRAARGIEFRRANTLAPFSHGGGKPVKKRLEDVDPPR